MSLVSMWKFDSPHIPISIGCYLACLFFPGYYIGERFEPEMAYLALLMGWLGPLEGHIAWFANPLFLLALLSADRPKLSSILGFTGLALAISFVFYKKTVITGSNSPIVAYGWGYGLWITSIAILSVGQLLRARCLESNRIRIASTFTGCLILIGYMSYYFLGDNSLFAIRSERDREFETRCASAGEHISKKANDVKGIFFDPDWQLRIGFKKEKPNFKYIDGAGGIGLGHLNSGHLLFYETKDRSGTGGYVKYVLGDHKGIQSDSLESEYAVITKYFSIPPRLNISGATVTIKDRRDNSILATSSFVIENESGRFCGNPRGSFSTSEFMTTVLGLTKQFPSAFK